MGKVGIDDRGRLTASFHLYRYGYLKKKKNKFKLGFQSFSNKKGGYYAERSYKVVEIGIRRRN